MELNIIHHEKNPLLQRSAITATVSFEGATPSNLQVGEALAKKLGIETSLVVVKQINTKFSHQQAECTALAYASAEAKKKAEKVLPHIRKKEQEAAKAAAPQK